MSASKRFKTIKEWQFYYTNTDHSETIVGVITCKEPQRTKMYKDNLNRLHTNGVRSVGYRDKIK